MAGINIVSLQHKYYEEVHIKCKPLILQQKGTYHHIYQYNWGIYMCNFHDNFLGRVWKDGDNVQEITKHENVYKTTKSFRSYLYIAF